MRRDDSPAPRLVTCAFRPCDAVALQTKALAELVKEYGVAGAPCVGVMEPGSYNLLLVEAPGVAPTELKAAVRWRIKDLIDFHIDDAVIDVFDIPGQGVQGRPKMMYVVVTRATLVQSYIERAREAKLNLSVIDIPELALRNIAALLPEDQQGVALLHFTRRGGYMTLTRQSALYLTRTIEVGADALMQSARTDSAELPPALQRALDSVVLEIQRSLDYYESHYAQPPITHLAITPPEQNPAQDITRTVQYLATHLGIAVRQLDINQVLHCDPPLGRALQARSVLSVGAALRVEGRAL